MFEIGILCPKSGKEMEKRIVRRKKQTVYKLKEMNSKQIIFKMKFFTSIFFFFKWLLTLTMLSTEIRLF